MSASVRHLDLQKRNEIASLVIRELVRARRVDGARSPAEAPDPVNCLVTRAQLMTRVLGQAQRVAVGHLEDAAVAVQDAVVAHELMLTIAMARDLPTLMELDDLNLAEIVAQRFEQLRVASRARLVAIVRASRTAASGSIAKMTLIGEHQDLRQAAFAYESAAEQLTRMIRMNTDFEQLCSMESKRR